MSKLNIDQKTISNLFSDKRADFLIPDYQRPYAWTRDECETLWDDLKSFAFPNDTSADFDSENDEYFLGPIVTFKNSDGKQEIIDGQQRLTTVMLLLRAFYSKFETAQDDEIVETRKLIARCIWKTDEVGRPVFDRLKIDSEVASDDDKDEFLTILETGKADEKMRSRYADTFRFFSEKIIDFIDKTPMWTYYFPLRILNNVIMLPIEAESQDTALRIFSTLNDRGLPLSDADIFKSQFYKFYSQRGEKDAFIARWKVLEEGANATFHPMRGTPMDELFTRYMYYRRAKKGIKDTTTASLRDFFSADAGYRTKSVSRRNTCSRPSVQPERIGVPVVELLPHGPVAPLRAAVVALRGGGVRPVEQVDVGVGRHRGELLGGRPGVPRVHVAPPEHRLHPAHERHAAVVPEHLAQARVQALRGVV